MKPSETARIVPKARYDQQHFISIPTPTVPLGPSSIRIKTILLGISANNLAYCAAGDVLHWWSTYPVPTSAPPPYNDATTYGIAVGWGYCMVTDSTINAIRPGRILNGFFSVSSHSVDLQLREVPDFPTHFIETSPHRAKVMSIYQRYFLQPDNFKLELTDPSVTLTPTLKPVWSASYVLAKHVFPENRSVDPIHPFGVPVSPWTSEHADLTGTCIICIGSGTKTSRGFLHQLAVTRSDPTFSVIEVTSSSTGCETYLHPIPVRFEHSLLHYDDISPTEFAGSHLARKYVVLNFGGGRNNSLDGIAEAISSSVPSAELIVVQIGGEAQRVDPEAAKGKMEVLKKWNAVRMNTTAIMDEPMTRYGEVRFFEELEEAWKGVLDGVQTGTDGKSRILGMEVNVLEGNDGLSECWGRLCRGEIAGSEGILVRLNAGDDLI